jgi:DNA-binding beta-propeller fold protein YncE
MRSIHSKLLLTLLLIVGLSACGPDRDGTEAGAAAPVTATAASDQALDYTFDSPAASFDLPEALTEISGVAVLSDGNVAAVQDELGTVFILNPETGQIADQKAFGNPDDYEGIALAGDRLFVLRSNGNLHELVNWQSASPTTREYETEVLSGDNDTEGLAYDALNNRLLIAAKEDPGAGLDEDAQRAIYAFDLATNTVQPQPVFTINLADVDRMAPGEENFRPSSVAVHPETNEVYVLSSVRKVIVVLAQDGSVRAVWPLPESLFPQPEGLDFLPGGDLLISSEGGDGPGKLYRFTR